MRSTSTTVFAVAEPSEVQESGKVARLGKISSELSCRAFRGAGKREGRERKRDAFQNVYTLVLRQVQQPQQGDRDRQWLTDEGETGEQTQENNIPSGRKKITTKC